MSVAILFRAQFAAAIAAALALGLLLLALRPRDRASVRHALLILVAAALAGLAASLAPSTSAAAAVAAHASVLLVGMVLLRLAAIFVFRVALPAGGAHPARIVEDLATAGLYLVWGLAWLRLAGVDPASLVTTSAVITAVLAFSMQDTLGNILGGVLLQLDRSIRVGDWVRIDEVSGQVAEVRWRHTIVETRDGNRIVFPNTWLLKNRFTVVGAGGEALGKSRRWVRVNVDLASEPGEVCRVLEEAVAGAGIENVEPVPAPDAVVMEIGPRHASYALRYWMRDPRPDDATDSKARTHILAALTRHGMKLGAPYREELAIHDDEAHRQAMQSSDQERRVRALAQVELFAALSEAERRDLASHLSYTPFVRGDVITRQGAVAHWLYLMVSGEADVWIETAAGRSPIATLKTGSVFGEMGMMTGEPRTATVTARSDVTCYRLDKAGFESIIRARPDIAGAISRVLASRRAELDKEKALPHGAAGEPHHADILEKIRDFFGLGPA